MEVIARTGMNITRGRRADSIGGAKMTVKGEVVPVKEYASAAIVAKGFYGAPDLELNSYVSVSGPGRSLLERLSRRLRTFDIEAEIVTPTQPGERPSPIRLKLSQDGEKFRSLGQAMAAGTSRLAWTDEIQTQAHQIRNRVSIFA